MEVTADRSADRMYIATANPESPGQEPELMLDENKKLPRSWLATTRNKSLAGTVAFIQDIVFLYRLLRHPNTPWHAKGALFLPVMYLCSPIQLIPNFIPVLGQMDDVFVIWVAKKCAVKWVGEEIRRECRDEAAAFKFPRWMRSVEEDKNRSDASSVCGLSALD